MEYISDHRRIIRLEERIEALEHRLSQCIANSGILTPSIEHVLENAEVLPLNNAYTLNTVRSKVRRNGYLTTDFIELPEITHTCTHVKNGLRFPNDLRH